MIPIRKYIIVTNVTCVALAAVRIKYTVKNAGFDTSKTQ